MSDLKTNVAEDKTAGVAAEIGRTGARTEPMSAEEVSAADRTRWRERTLKHGIGESPYETHVRPGDLFRGDGLTRAGLADEVSGAAEGYDLIVRATNPGHRGAVTFARILSKGAARPTAECLPDVPLYEMSVSYLTDPSLDRMTGNLTPERIDLDPECTRPFRLDSPEVEAGLAKDWLDHNWMLNSSMLLARPLKAVGVPAVLHEGWSDVPLPAAAFLGRNALLLLQHLVRLQSPPETEGEIIRLMSAWKGTGKHAGTHEPWFGATASRCAILGNLRRLGLLDDVPGTSERPRLAVSDAGRRFAAMLPKEAYDPDLPFRLDIWTKEGTAAVPKMEAYVLRMFGALKSRLGRKVHRREAPESGPWTELAAAMAENRWSEADVASRAQVAEALVRAMLMDTRGVPPAAVAAVARHIGRFRRTGRPE